MKLVKLYESVLIEDKLESCVVKGGDVKSCISQYPEILEPHGFIYKASLMSLSDLLGQYYDIADDFKSGGGFDFTYKPKTLIQSWTRDESDAEGLTEVSPFLLQTIRKYENVKDNPSLLNGFIEQIKNESDNITVPIVIELNSDGVLIDSKLLKSEEKDGYKNELFRIGDRPTRVNAEIIEPLFKSVFELLKAIKQHEVRSHQQG